MADIKLIRPDTELPKLRHMNWDVVINKKPYYVVQIPGFVHTIGGRWGENDYWAYPRDAEPNYDTLIEFCCEHPVSWGIEYRPYNMTKTKWDETEARSYGSVIITRNGEKFCDVAPGINYGIDKARVMITQFQEHPVNLNEIDFVKQLIGRKVWWRSEPAVITHYCVHQACVILEPDGIEHFTVPAEFADEEPDYYEDDSVKADLLDKNIWWFRKEEENGGTKPKTA